jgi:hypothetical protein
MKEAAVAAVEDVKSSLTAESILDVKDLAPHPYNVPEWGGTLYIRQLSAAEGLELGEFIGDKPKGANARVVLFCLCDANGKRLFADHQLKAMQSKSMKVLNRLSNECMRVNGVGADTKEQKAIDADAKNV